MREGLSLSMNIRRSSRSFVKRKLNLEKNCLFGMLNVLSLCCRSVDYWVIFLLSTLYSATVVYSVQYRQPGWIGIDGVNRAGLKPGALCVSPDPPRLTIVYSLNQSVVSVNVFSVFYTCFGDHGRLVHFYKAFFPASNEVS